jgi:hypothetical protein
MVKTQRFRSYGRPDSTMTLIEMSIPFAMTTKGVSSDRRLGVLRDGWGKKIGFLLAAFLISVTAVSAQESGSVSDQTVDHTPTIDFGTRLSTAAREMQWSQTYWRSYEKTGEIPYLHLSAQHCRNAIQLMLETQSLLPSTTRLHYVAKNEKFQACRYYQHLRSASERLSVEHHLSAVDGNACQ